VFLNLWPYVNEVVELGNYIPIVDTLALILTGCPLLLVQNEHLLSNLKHSVSEREKKPSCGILKSISDAEQIRAEF